MLKNADLIKNIQGFLSKNISPYVNKLDNDPKELKNIFLKFKRLKYFSIYVSKQYGGTTFSHKEKIQIQEIMGSFGGAFSFLQVQTATPCWLLLHSKNNALKRHYLTSIANGKLTIGNATSHMKPNSKIMVKGYKEKKGYRVSGNINFATGSNFFDELTIGFNIGKNKEAFATIPFKSIQNNKLGKISINPVIETISMQSMNTVSLVLENYFIPDEEIIVIWPRQTFFDKYKEFLPYAFTIGIALESLRLVKDSFLIKSNSKLRNKLHLLQKKLNQCRKELRNTSEKSNPDILFAEIINISWICVQFSLLVCGGVGLLSRHSIQRLYREIVIWFIPRTYPSTIEKWIEKLII